MLTITEKKSKPPKKLTDIEKIDRAIADTARGLPSGDKLADSAKQFIRAHSNDLGWDQWVASEIEAVIHDRMRGYIRSDRSSAWAERGITNFKDQTKEPTVSKFEVRYRINEENEWKPLREMRKDDLLFVADDYKQRAESNRLEALFFEALAKKVGRKAVGDVFTDRSLESFRNAIRSPN